MQILSTKKLIINAILALVKPFSAFRSIPENHRVNYKTLIIILFVGGWVWNLLRFWTVEGTSVFTYPLVGFINLMLAPIFSVGIWFAATILFYQIGRNLGKTVSIYQLEIVAFYLWLVWFLAPIFDLPHLLYGVKIVGIFGAGAHTSWFFTFSFLPLLSFFLLRDLIKVSKKQLFLAVLIAASLPFFGRFFIENIPLFLNIVLRTYGHPIGYNLASLFAAPVGVVFVIYYWRKIKNLNPGGKYLLNASLISAIYCFFTFYLLFATPFLKMFPAGKTNSVSQTRIGYFDLGRSHHTHSYLFSGTVYSGAAVTHPPAGPANDDANTYWSDTYTGGSIGTLDFDPAKTTIDYIKFTININAATANNQAGNGPKIQGCIRGGTSGTYFCSPWTENLTTGSGSQDFTINSGSIWTYDTSATSPPTVPNGDGVAATTTDWNNLVAALHGTASTPNNNDVIVHSWTQGDLNNTGETGDKISYDSVILKIHYYTHLTQNIYRWYQNNDLLQPTVPLANENSPATTVDRTQVVRLRMSVLIQTGNMDISTQAFKLQYAAKSGVACSGGGEVWTDVATIGANEPWRGYDATPADGTTISSTLLTGSTDIESYEETNNSVNNPTALADPSNAIGEWDWVIQNYGANGQTDYCFRMVNADGSEFTTYSTNYPIISTPVVVARSIKGKVNIQGNVKIP